MPGAFESTENKGTARAMNSNEISTALISGAILLCPFSQGLKLPPLPAIKETQSIKSPAELKHSVTLEAVYVVILNVAFCVCYRGRFMPHFA